MLIRCPECRFERDIDISRIPATATTATCPKCGCRFRFRDPETGRPVRGEEAEAPSGPAEESSAGRETAPHLPTEREGDDPLPPGAVIPGLGDEERPTVPGSDDERPDRAAMDSPDEIPQSADNAGDSAPLFSGPARAADADGEKDDRDIPWERPDRYGVPGALYHTILRVMFRAPEFFAALRGGPSVARPAVFFVLLSFLDTLFSRLWSMNSLNALSQATTDPQALAVVDEFLRAISSGMAMTLIMAPFIALFRLFFLAGLYHLMIRLAQPDRADFAVVVRVIAYSAAPLILCVVPVIGAPAGSLWFVACTFIGCKYALGLAWSRVTLALTPLFLLELAGILFLARMLASVM